MDTLLTPEQRQYLLHRFKHGPNLPREMLPQFLRDVLQVELGIDALAAAEAYMAEWRAGNKQGPAAKAKKAKADCPCKGLFY